MPAEISLSGNAFNVYPLKATENPCFFVVLMGYKVGTFTRRLYVWQLETQLFALPYIWLAYIFEASYSTLVTPVSKKSSVDQSELEK